MTDSVDRKDEPKATKLARLKALPTRPYTEREDITEIPAWVKAAYAKMEVLGGTYATAAKEFDRKAETLKNWNRAPAVKAWREELRRFVNDPVAMAEAVIHGSVLDCALDQVWALKAAKRANDYREVRQATKDILLSERVLRPQASGKLSAQGLTVNITLGSGDLEPPTGESTYEIVKDAQYEWDDEAD